MEEAAWIWEAFWYLSRRRLVLDAGPQHIQVSEMVAYASARGITVVSDVDDFLRFIDMMDLIWMEHVQGKRKEAADKARIEAERRAKAGRGRRR